MTMEGLAPIIHTINRCSREEHSSEGLDFERDFFVMADVEFQGSITFQVKVGVKLNWPLPAFVEIPVTLNIKVADLTGRARLCFSNSSRSFLQFLRRPNVKVNVESVLGHSENTLNLQSLPKVTSIIRETVDKEIADLVHPKRLFLSVPMVNEGFKLDKNGCVI